MSGFYEWQRKQRASQAAAEAKTIRAIGVNGQMQMDAGGDVVRIARKGALGFLTQGYKGVKEIYIGDISSIQYKDPGGATNGYMQFTFLGGSEAKGGLFQAVSDENTVMFNALQAGSFAALKSAIEKRHTELRVAAGPAPAGIDIASQIERLAALKESGGLTADEFAAAKQRIIEQQ